MSIIKGGDMMLFVNGKSIGYATNHTLSINADTKETSTKDSGGKWQTSEVGVLSWTASSENLMSNDQEGNGYKNLVKLMIDRTVITGHFDLEGNSPNLDADKYDNVPKGGWTPRAIAATAYSKGYVGSMIITSIELNAPNGENATFTVNFTGTGALTPKYTLPLVIDDSIIDGGEQNKA